MNRTMTDYREFFRILCRHRQGYSLSLPYAVAVNHPGQDHLPCTLYMVPLPPGEPNGLSALAREWRATEGAA